jgi:feruloyl-CoA synthase
MSAAPFRDISLGRVDVEREARPDGTVLLRSRVPLGAYPRRLTERLLHWAEHAPDRVFLARRGPDGKWIELTYAQARNRVLGIAQALIDRGLSAERTVAILSENSIEHALLALAAMHVGVPYAPISPAYSLLSTDFGKLRHCLGLMRPGLVFAGDGVAYDRALHSAMPEGAEIVVAGAGFDRLAATKPTAAVDKAFEAVGPETVGKILFTSGSTGLPKGVINTQRMLCANLQQIMQALPCLAAEPPVIVDWLPWNHTFGGNHNFGIVLYNGGTLYIDDGKPVPALIAKTVENLREVAPTVYFNVPKGFEDLIPFFRREPALREKFFSRLQLIFYAGAGLPQPVWDALEALAVETLGERVVITSGLGMTESAPSAMFAHWKGSWSGLLGVPLSGLTLKLASVGDKAEARYRGPNVTPGYWRQPELTSGSFDEEGFYRTGDAVKFVDDARPEKGLLFDGRIAEDFKLSTGTWVSVGVMRAALLDAFQGLMQDAVITAPDHDFVGAILFPVWPACRVVAGLPDGAPMSEVAAHPAVRAKVQQALDALAAKATGSANRVARVLITDQPPSIDIGEVTDKGSFNQRIVLKHRAALVGEIYAEPPGARVVALSAERERA